MQARDSAMSIAQTIPALRDQPRIGMPIGKAQAIAPVPAASSGPHASHATLASNSTAIAGDASAHEPHARRTAVSLITPAEIAARPESALPHIEMLLRARIGPEKMGRYLQGGRAIVIENGELLIKVPSPILAGIVERSFLATITDAAREAMRSMNVTPRIVVTGQLIAEPAAASTTTKKVVTAKPRTMSATPVRHRFEDFIIGDATRVAHESARRHARGDGASGVLFLHGSVGMGKTHLLCAAAAEALAKSPSSQVQVLTAEQFTNEYISAVRNSRMDDFRKRYRRCDLLCIDDVQILQGRAATQQELQQTLDAVLQRGGRVIVSGASAPRQLQNIADSLVSRLCSGMVASLGKLDEAGTRRAIAALAQRRGLVLESAALDAMTRWSRMHIGGDAATREVSMRDIEGLVTKVDAVHRLMGTLTRDAGGELHHGAGSVGLLCVEQALRSGQTATATGSASRASGSVTSLGPRIVKAEDILRRVCERLHVDRADLSSRTRHPRVVLARSVIVWLCRKLTTLSFPEIARVLGRPNHSTVITALQRLNRLLGEHKSVDLGSGLGGVIGLEPMCKQLEVEVRAAQ